MQTFMPYPNVQLSVEALDNKRLGKQRVEAQQILNALRGKSKGWTKHPAVLMWKGHEHFLEYYLDQCISEWVNRGFNNNMLRLFIDHFDMCEKLLRQSRPSWLGDDEFHASHRANLKRKSLDSLEKYTVLMKQGKHKLAMQQLKVYEWYRQFNWKESPSMPYVWPSGSLS